MNAQRLLNPGLSHCHRCIALAGSQNRQWNPSATPGESVAVVVLPNESPSNPATKQTLARMPQDLHSHVLLPRSTGWMTMPRDETRPIERPGTDECIAAHRMWTGNPSSAQTVYGKLQAKRIGHSILAATDRGPRHRSRLGGAWQR